MRHGRKSALCRTVALAAAILLMFLGSLWCFAPAIMREAIARDSGALARLAMLFRPALGRDMRETYPRGASGLTPRSVDIPLLHYENAPVAFAIEAGKRDVAFALLGRGTESSVGMYHGLTAVHLAAKNNDVLLLKRMLRLGARHTPVDPEHWSPLMQAGGAEAVRELLDAGADPNWLFRGAGPALRWHARDADLSILRELLAGGADVDAAAGQLHADWHSPLIDAAWAGRLDAVELLLSRGADPTLATTEGKTALDFAIEPAIRKRLELAFAEWNSH